MDDWQFREYLVALVEKSLTPTATVEWNCRLPVLGTNRTRQCDAVIRYGDAPRDTLAIVEVQRRARRPSLTEFHGWLQKMRDVGAQQLICVSEAGFPRSVREEVATRIGPTVRLLTLRNLLDPTAVYMPIADGGVYFQAITWDFTGFGPLVFDEKDYPALNALPRLNARFGPDVECFQLGDGPPSTLRTLMAAQLEEVQSAYFEQTGEPAMSAVTFEFGTGLSAFWYCEGDERFQVRSFVVEVKIDSQWHELPVQRLVYESVIEADGILRWVATASKDIDGSVVSVDFVYEADADGTLELVRIGGMNRRRVLRVHTFQTAEEREAFFRKLKGT